MFFRRWRNTTSNRSRSVHVRPHVECLESRELLTVGALDPGFGTGGVALANFTTGNDQGLAVALQPDGKVVVAGTAVRSGTGLDFAVARTADDHTSPGLFRSAFYPAN